MKPNILFVHYDSMRANALSCNGNPYVQTPNHERLAQNGVVFDNCFAQNPVCSPSRCSMMSGYYPHTSSHRTLWQLMQPHEPSLLRYLKSDGYQVVNYGDKNDLYSQKYLDEIYDNIDELRYGFEPRTAYRKNWKASNPYTLDDPRYYSFLLDAIPDDLNLPPALHKSYAGAIDFIDDWNPGDKPFMLYMPTSPPHPPYTCLERFYHMYNPASLKPYITPTVGITGAPSYVDFYQNHYATHDFGFDYAEKICAVYHGMVSYMDYVLGRLLAALDKKGIFEQTIIVVTSDHGDWAGNRGLFEKHHNAFDDDMIHVPLIISAPGMKRGIHVTGQVELFDIMPTILDLANISCTHDHFAVTLLPELHGERDNLERIVFSEGGYNTVESTRNKASNQADGVNQPSNPYYRMINLSKQYPSTMCRGACIRTLQHKLVRRENGENELYDLTNDPREMTNLYHDKKMVNIRLHLEDLMLRWYLNTSDASPIMRDPRGFM